MRNRFRMQLFMDISLASLVGSVACLIIYYVI